MAVIFHWIWFLNSDDPRKFYGMTQAISKCFHFLFTGSIENLILCDWYDNKTKTVSSKVNFPENSDGL